MNYFDPYLLCVDETVSAAWKSQLADAESTPWLARALARRGSELFPRFATAYIDLRAMPRAARRLIQRRLARSRDVLACAPEWLQRRNGRQLQYKLARSLAGAALLLALTQSVQAATITVTTNKPGINDGDGKCSLIEAIVNANNDAATHPDCPAGSGADTIVLPAGSTHMLAAPYNGSLGFPGLPSVTSEITVEGNGAKIKRKSSASEFSLLVVSSVGDLELRDIMLSGGNPNRNFILEGGAILNSGTLRVISSKITGNRAGSGGGIYNTATGNLTIDNCTITRNTASGDGGGLFNDRGSVTILNSRISQNRASRFGSGIGERILSQGLGTIFISNTSISQNAGVFGVFLASGTSNIENSTISGNRGIGIYRYGGIGNIENTTVSGNRLGGILSSGTLTITNSTVSNNKGKLSGGVESSFGQLILKRTIVTGNKSPSGREVSASTVVADDFNLFGANGNAGVAGFTPGPTDIVPGVGVSVGKILGPLKDNGGQTKTHALVPGSPAIDAIPGADPECTGTDQRGMPRPQGAECDIGAFEK